jgi:hypothetical protein
LILSGNERRSRHNLKNYRNTLGALALAVLIAVQVSAGTSGRVLVQANGGLSLPITTTTDPGDVGLNAAISLGIRPLVSTPELQVAARGSYSRFLSSTPERSVRSVMTGGLDILFTPDQEGDQKWYLVIGAGFARTDKRFTQITDPYGCFGAGAEIGSDKKPRLIVELRLTDISNSTYGDFRYFTLSAGIKF